MTRQIVEFLKADEERLSELVEKYPNNIPAKELSKFLGMNVESLHAVLERTDCPFGLAWRKGRAFNRAFHIPTAVFVRWYTRL